MFIWVVYKLTLSSNYSFISSNVPTSSCDDKYLYIVFMSTSLRSWNTLHNCSNLYSFDLSNLNQAQASNSKCNKVVSSFYESIGLLDMNTFKLLMSSFLSFYFINLYNISSILRTSFDSSSLTESDFICTLA